MTVARLTLILSLLVAPLPQVERRSVAEYLAELTGPKSRNCGSYLPGGPNWEERQKTVLDCAMNAVAGGEPFTFMESGLPVDSSVYTGWVRTSKGVLLRYSYDSAPCGNPSCKERFITSACPDPNVYMQGPWLRFGCEKPK